jgi:probable phosphoglycerate mutase
MDPRAPRRWIGSPRRRVYLVRHGDVTYFDKGGHPYPLETVPLNADGRLQAQAAAQALATVPLDRVLTSGLARGVETALLVIAQRELILEYLPELREIEPGRLDFLDDAAPDAVERALLGALPGDLGPLDRFLDGETFGAFAARVWGCFQGVLAERGWQHLLIVGHNIVNRLLLCQVLGAGLGALGAVEQDAGCINVLDVDDGGRCLVRMMNFTPANPVKSGLELTSLERLYLQWRCRPPGCA